MSRMKRLMLETLAIAAMSTMGNDPFSMPTSHDEGMHFNPNYKPIAKNKVLREFSLKGEKVMAYSKKDAIKRLNYKK